MYEVVDLSDGMKVDRWRVKGRVWKVDMVYVSGHSISEEVGDR